MQIMLPELMTLNCALPVASRERGRDMENETATRESTRQVTTLKVYRANATLSHDTANNECK